MPIYPDIVASVVYVSKASLTGVSVGISVVTFLRFVVFLFLGGALGNGRIISGVSGGVLGGEMVFEGPGSKRDLEEDGKMLLSSILFAVVESSGKPVLTSSGLAVSKMATSMFLEFGLSVAYAAIYSCSGKISLLRGYIPVTRNPDIMFSGEVARCRVKFSIPGMS